MFNKSRLLGLLTLLSVSTMSSLYSDNWDYCDECVSNRMYVGAFGGGLYSKPTHMYQMGTAFFSDFTSEGPLAVYASGDTEKTSSGFGGIQIGTEATQSTMNLFSSNWTLTPGAEVEGFWYRHTKTGHLFNDTIGRLEEHDFLVSFRMKHQVYLANVVFSLNNKCRWGAFTPYVAGGIGATRISINNATSIQVAPLEAFNHFNSKQSDSTWAFAAQAKAGLRYNICGGFHIFGEYRYLFIDTSNYILGSTAYPATDHVPTSPWNVQVKNLHYNAFTIGIQYDL